MPWLAEKCEPGEKRGRVVASDRVHKARMHIPTHVNKMQHFDWSNCNIRVFGCVQAKLFENFFLCLETSTVSLFMFKIKKIQGNL